MLTLNKQAMFYSFKSNGVLVIYLTSGLFSTHKLLLLFFVIFLFVVVVVLQNIFLLMNISSLAENIKFNITC